MHEHKIEVFAAVLCLLLLGIGTLSNKKRSNNGGRYNRLKDGYRE